LLRIQPIAIYDKTAGDLANPKEDDIYLSESTYTIMMV
jgi:hypothetical protein